MTILVTQTQNANTPSVTATAGVALASNPARLAWSLQNLGTNTLFVQLGSSASTGAFHIVLKGGTATDDGLGGAISQESGVIYTGPISVAGTSPRFTVLEIAP